MAALYAPHFRDGRFFNPWQLWPSRPRRAALVLAAALAAAARDARAAGRQRRRDPGAAEPRARRHLGRPLHLRPRHDGARAADRSRTSARGRWCHRATWRPASRSAPSRRRRRGAALHNHYDHLDRWTVRRLPADTRWLVPLGLAQRLRRMGAAAFASSTGGTRPTTGPAPHLPAGPALVAAASRSRATPRSGARWLIEAGGSRIYFAGDTGWFAGFAEIGRRFGPIDAALLPIGAYEPRWFMRYQHMDPAEAVPAFAALGARTWWACTGAPSCSPTSRSTSRRARSPAPWPPLANGRRVPPATRPPASASAGRSRLREGAPPARRAVALPCSRRACTMRKVMRAALVAATLLARGRRRPRPRTAACRPALQHWLDGGGAAHHADRARSVPGAHRGLTGATPSSPPSGRPATPIRRTPTAASAAPTTPAGRRPGRSSAVLRRRRGARCGSSTAGPPTSTLRLRPRSGRSRLVLPGVAADGSRGTRALLPARGGGGLRPGPQDGFRVLMALPPLDKPYRGALERRGRRRRAW